MPVNYMDNDLSIIGNRLDNFSTAERHAKALEHRAKKAEAINAAVASKRAVEADVVYENICLTCPTCGQDIPQK
jgi:cytochrome c5